GYDDSLDVFGVHGVGGFVGTLLAGVFAAEMFGGKEGDLAIGSQVATQLLASVITIVYTGIVSFAILKAIDATIGLRVTQEHEVMGLDTTLHAEAGYDL
ncbi:MAG: ammonium transporter, partial [Myxococcales bacterium]|nr:ammonium transporter [Myxococcales bacterium]